MKDVAEKLKDWKDIQLDTNVSIKDIINLQLQLQKYYYKNYNGIDEKCFPDYEKIKDWKEETKIRWTKQNILRIFDQIAEYNVWFDRFIYNGLVDKNEKQNRLFEIIDALHFLFNIVSIWQIEQYIKSIQSYSNVPTHDVMFSTMKLAVVTSQLLNTIPWKNWKSKTPVDMFRLIKFINNFVEQTVSIFVSLKMEKSDIYKMYYAKNKQNINRQKKGY